MDMETLCSEIQLPQVIFEEITGFLQAYEWKRLEPLAVGMTDPDQAEQSYKALADILGCSHTGILACQLTAAVRVHSRYRAMGIPDEIYFGTMACFSRFLGETHRRTGKWHYDRGFWSYRQTSMMLFRIGELEYELCREPLAVSLHIPSDARFTPEAVNTSLEAARAFLARYYPRWAQAPFVCHSWLLSPELGKLLPDASNIRSFQRRFAVREVQPEDDGFFQWLFETSPNTPVEELKEDTTLRRSAKSLLLAGGHIGSAAGVMTEI